MPIKLVFFLFTLTAATHGQWVEHKTPEVFEVVVVRSYNDSSYNQFIAEIANKLKIWEKKQKAINQTIPGSKVRVSFLRRDNAYGNVLVLFKGQRGGKERADAIGLWVQKGTNSDEVVRYVTHGIGIAAGENLAPIPPPASPETAKR